MIIESLVGAATEHLWSNWDDVLTGATAFSLISHLVNTFPTPKNIYLQWFLGGVQYIVGQRKMGQNTMQGNTTVPLTMSRDSSRGTGNGLTATVEIAGDAKSAELLKEKKKKDV